MKYKNIEIDHIFTVVKEDFPEKQKLLAKDSIGFERVHQGQGTTAQFLPFEENYLEFIWLSNVEESKTNPLQLHKRFTATCSCPYGIAYRGELSEEEKQDFWIYKPPYVTSGEILVHNSWLEDFSLPALFVMNLPVKNNELHPKNLPRFNQSKLNKGRIEKVTLHLPNLNPVLNNFPQITQVKSDSYKLEIDGLEKLDLSLLSIKL